ncbi:LTA synthase family protein, partial [Bacteroidales bacterium OttesenSCG-928-I21]|nr:LTA synthase family protein [Bacteroidales bacterium OttesenSCG-928-I21]
MNTNYLESENGVVFPVKKDILKEFISEYPDRIIDDYEYPLEGYPENIPDVLSPYFYDSDSLPNIVILIVESLGRELSGGGDGNISFTPFIDSLAKNGLYWKNCLSTTMRSYGAVPAITGSLPVGLKGFQFGNMPKHHSLISILNENNYQTNTFYGGDITFDNIYDYLIEQKIGYMPNFYYDNNKYKSEGLTNRWGLLDNVLFDKSIKILNDSAFSNPIFNLYITLTSHDELTLKDSDRQNYFLEKTKNIISRLPNKEQSKYNNVDFISSMVYVDESIKKFMSDYSKRDDFGNTIFIITGDHASGLLKTNFLSSFHVPLIIWSPLIKTSAEFLSIVTHNDITPSIASLLQNKYGLNMPDKVHWLSDGLNTSPDFQAKSTLLFLNYSREISELLYRDYVFVENPQLSDKAIYKINKNLELSHINNHKQLKELSHKFLIFNYVNNYVYHNDRLLHADNNKSQKYETLLEFENDSLILCETPNYKPSENGFISYELFPEAMISNKENFEKLRISINADISIYDNLMIDEYMKLEIACIGDNMKHPARFKDNVVKLLTTNTINANQWYKLDITKDIIVSDAKNLNLSVKICTVEWDYIWVPNSKLSFKNVKIKIE